jgi:xanthine/CO dehydrogenase XdhC/CoxF family maturation factor
MLVTAPRAASRELQLKHWQEMGHIVDRVLYLGRQGRSAALAIVTEIAGSAYRRPGAKLLIDDEGGVLGGVSGGCLEEDVRQVGLAVIRTGQTRVLSYDTSSDDTTVFGFGLGCGGRIDVLVLPLASASAAGVFTQLEGALAQDDPLALAVCLEEGGPGGIVLLGARGPIAGTLGDSAFDLAATAAAQAALDAKRPQRQALGTRPLFTDVLRPPPKLLVCGAGDDARPLVDLGASIGFRVYVADHRAGLLSSERFPAAHKLLKLRPQHPSDDLPTDRSTYAVVKTHAFQHDRAWVERLLAGDAAYIGVLGPRARVERILTELGVHGERRVFGPVGLDLGADGPEQVALSVVAEVLALYSRRQPRHLRDREGALHVDA